MASIRKVGLALAIGTVLIAIVVTQWPFEYRPTRYAVHRRWTRIDWSWFPRDYRGDIRVDRDLVLNLMMLIPLGVGFGLWRRVAAMRVVVEGLVLGIATSAALEVAQLVTRHRYTSFADVWRNAFGCMLGCVIALVILRRVAGPRRAGRDVYE